MSQSMTFTITSSIGLSMEIFQNSAVAILPRDARNYSTPSSVFHLLHGSPNL